VTTSDLVQRHYSNTSVREEIARFARKRWVAVQCTKTLSDGRPVFLRYTGRPRTPIQIADAGGVQTLLDRLSGLHPRSFYATANIYHQLENREDAVDLENVMACTPTWDIDNEPERWEATVEAAKEIISFLEARGVSRSVFAKWSGRGCHVHLHEASISPRLAAKLHPLNIAYAIVEYVNRSLRDKFKQISARQKANSMLVENEMDPQRLFTCPLSLHKNLDRVCVCIGLADLDKFKPKWTSPSSYRHFKDWGEHVVGEADELAQKAYTAVGPYATFPHLPRKRRPPLDQEIIDWRQKMESEFGGPRP